MPELMYYDIFKNYYANLQEEDAYFINANTDIKNISVEGEEYNPNEVNAPISSGIVIELEVDGNISQDDVRLTVTTFRGSVQKIEPYELGKVTQTTGLITTKVNDTVYNELIKVESIYGIGGGKLSTFKIAEVDIIS